MIRKTLMTVALAALTAAGINLPSQAQMFSTQTVMVGLNNPRGLAFGPDGSLYVAEAGLGANGAANAPSFIDGSQSTVFYGETSGVSKLKNGVQTRVISDLPSLADASNGGAGGLSHISFDASGNLFGAINFGGEGAARTNLLNAGVTNAKFLGTISQLNLAGSPSASVVTDVTAYAVANNLEGPTQPGKPFETNAYGLTTLKGGGFAVTDAGGNYVATVGSNGIVNGVVMLPNFPNSSFPGLGGPTSQAVPTSVSEGDNGTLYVSELGGFPFTPGDSHIDVISNGVLTNRFGGFTTLVDVEFYDGELYALQMTSNGLASQNPGPGQLLEVDPLTGQITVLYNGLLLPGGLAVQDDHTFYITTGSVFPGGGSVIKLTSVPEPSTFAFLLGFTGAGAGCLLKRRRK